ncbi:speckle targeted PIP5K1A-regulated poly(A) polymerase-like [Osmia bicornis bicornis]|uniref:speckle targeted PIP5K1A-regulated poly(A) polymerase-like n=1 Tax=Osmia bicornis bicornis TaxID=1437191 RepID=UPI0010F571AE|nr:speckle targeted PIP5K1A-regulated poly(A) polymerase-like [Osmia bicornis bicornis]
MSKHCDICSMHFQDEYALQGHLAGKKHLKKFQQVEINERSIVVSPLPKFIPSRGLIDYFQQYGTIKWYQFGPSYLIIEFCDRSSAEVLLNKPIWINNVKLKIKKRRAFKGKPKPMKQNTPIENNGVINYDNIKHLFEGEATFENQLTMFLNAVQLTDFEIETRYETVCTHLDKIFKVIFPKCKTYKFGSTQTGLGFKECDLDIYMDIGEPICESESASPDVWTMQKIFKEVKKVMYGMNCAFSDIIAIPKAKTPIIKFCYVRTNVSCDISFKNSLGIYKSNLIKYYISLDDRLRPLMMLIKYWAKHFKISCSGKISNYALILLIIFYLQQPSVNIIPPLMELQKTCQPQILNGWQMNFDENIALPPVLNENSIPELLHGFFFFYATFDFKSKVICPIDGTIHTESEFTDIENLPSCMDRYKACVKENENLKFTANRPMCVQDPIELSHNVTMGIHFPTLSIFVKYCAIGAEICTATSKNDYRDLMKTLLTTTLNKNSPENKFKISIPLNHLQHIKSKSIDTCTNETTKLTEGSWYPIVCNVIKDIFEKVFKVQVELLTDDVEAKQQKVDILSDVHTEKYQTIKFHCVGSHCVWRNRKINSVVLNPSLSCLQKEALISEQAIEDSNKHKPLNKVHLDFICVIEKKDHAKVSVIVINQNCDDRVFREFKHFVVKKLSEITTRTLMYIQQFNKF